ncbi:MAG: NDMA-dependent alcohol dehydrogenase [Acidimicrobiia bacterium]|nr:NDMA-dependent alcohol dehydrogenase [Acidimicrobiia bacterium]
MRSRAAVLLESPGRYRVVDVEVDEPKDNEVLVRYVASGLCHSDVHFLTGDHHGPLPFCAGHEGAGIVEAVGRGVATLRPGDHVVASFIPSCGRCRYCASGRMNLCQLGAHLQVGPMPDGTYRMHLDGQGLHQFLLISTFSQYAVVSEHSLVKVPDDLPLETLCLLGCGVGTGLGSSTNAAGVRPGDHVMIVGVGGVGASAVQGASIAGAAVIVAVDPVAFKREMAQKLGATHAFASMAEATDFMRSVTDGQGADAAVLAMGSPTNTDVAEAFAAIGKGGTVVVTGMAAATEPMGIPVHLLELGGMQKSIRGALFGMCNPPADILRQIDLYRAGRLKLDEMVTRRYRLDDIGVAVDDLLEGRNIRGVVVHDT